MGRYAAIVGVVVCSSPRARRARGAATRPRPVDGRADDAARTIAVYLVRDGKVAPVRRVIHAPQERRRVGALDALTDARPDGGERSAGYVSDVPSPPTSGVATWRSTAGGVARRRAEAGPLSRFAQAQVVHTLTDLPGVERVAFVVDGSEGRPLTRRDFEDETPQILVRVSAPGRHRPEPDSARRHGERLRGDRLDRRPRRARRDPRAHVHDRDVGHRDPRHLRHEGRLSPDAKAR